MSIFKSKIGKVIFQLLVYFSFENRTSTEA
jgi:hypothetical protein